MSASGTHAMNHSPFSYLRVFFVLAVSVTCFTKSLRYLKTFFKIKKKNLSLKSLSMSGKCFSKFSGGYSLANASLTFNRGLYRKRPLSYGHRRYFYQYDATNYTIPSFINRTLSLFSLNLTSA